ncbi:MAG: Asp-tRNA(Asn)/Glu-tRNA(Gln) amidotransferase subunit GatA [Planctomycetales bacterium]|nr:Asp-tRNA(Asn)/Glu-tRNA(Gln) amidotransferase subunit GatA [Planctomycetales bacterium]
MTRLELQSATELGRKIAAREISSRETTQYFLDRVEALNSRIFALNLVDGQRALELSDNIDKRLQAGESLSPLAGVPMAIKDVLCTRGIATTCGSRILNGFVPPYDATAVEKLLSAGLVPIGKSNMDEFAMGGSTENSAYGVTRNPWNLACTPGGSSGGAAAAVAAGLAPISIGTDTGGSVRQPAALCGVCGMKPTYGRISRYGLVAFASSLDQIGPLAHRVEDIASTLQILAGYDQRDSTSLNEPVPEYCKQLDAPIKGLRVGVIREHLEHESLDPEVRAAVERAQLLLEDMGVTMVDVHLPHTKYSVPAYYLIAPCEASSNLARYEGTHYGFRSSAAPQADSPLESMMVNSRSEGFGNEVKRRIMLGTFALSAGYYDAYYKKALRVRRLIAQDYRSAFDKVDVVLGPTTPTPAFKLGEKLDDPVQMYLCDLFTVGANLAGLPGISLPAGQDETGLPLAVQLQAPALDEVQLLNVAYQLQTAGLFQQQVAELS